jgi:hypothetical protein
MLRIRLVEREITRCTRELVPMGLLLLLVFPDQRSV